MGLEYNVLVICLKEVIFVMNYFVSKEIRKKVGIRDGNFFLFVNIDKML